MAIDTSKFIKHNVTDTCSVWNILSSFSLLSAAKTAGCVFCCTEFVKYECFDKPRKSLPSEKENTLQSRLKKEQSQGQFSVFSLDIDDLLDVEVLQKRMDLGKGELSSIALARRIRQGFLTDDQGARKLAAIAMEQEYVQTTPHLFGWLIYEYFLTDSDKDQVIKQHEEFDRPLGKYFENMYSEALQRRLMNNAT